VIIRDVPRHLFDLDLGNDVNRLWPKVWASDASWLATNLNAS
jgi:hypothetical protein